VTPARLSSPIASRDRVCPNQRQFGPTAPVLQTGWFYHGPVSKRHLQNGIDVLDCRFPIWRFSIDRQS